MGIEYVSSRKPYDPGPEPSQDTLPRDENPLDSPEARQKLSKLCDWWDQSRQALAESRYQMALDEDFYDGLQWDPDDEDELNGRGQLAYVFNRIAPSINWIAGSEKRMRFDFKIFARSKETVDSSEVKTELLKYVGDVNKAAFERSAAFKQTVIAGLSWLEDGIRNDPTDEPLFSRWESWRNVWYDHLSRALDYSQDSRYLFRSRWTDLDIAQAMFPGRADVLKAASVAANLYGTDDDELNSMTFRTMEHGRPIIRSSGFDDSSSVNNRRERVRLVEAWYRQPEQVRLLRDFPRLEGAVFDESDEYHAQVVDEGFASVYDATKLMMRCAVFVTTGTYTSSSLLQDMRSPYRHNRFPFTPIWCYRRGKDGTPYGQVRNLRDPQEDLNKRRSKAIYIFSSKGMIADNDAFDDWDEAAEELARPDMILKKKPGRDVQLINDNSMAEEHVMLMQEDARYIQDVSGVTDENLGRETNATSGIAIQARQDQGTVATAEIFDNYRLSFQFQGEKQISLIEQFYDEPKIFRITGPKGQLAFRTLNQIYTDDSGEEQVNDITASQSDFIVDEQDFHQSMRIALFEQLMAMIAKLPPETALMLLDLAIEMVDLPNTDEMVQRIRKVNGMGDPGQENDPQAQQEAMAQQQEAAAQNQIQQQAMLQQFQEQAAKTRKLLADAELQIEKARTERTKQIETINKQEMDKRRAEEDLQDKGRKHRMERVKMMQAADANRLKDAEQKAKEAERGMKQIPTQPSE